MSNHRFFQVSPGGELRPKQSAEEAVRIAPGDGYAWLDFRDPSPEDLKPLVELLGIHPLSVQDCLDENHIPKIDNFGKSTFLLLNSYSHRDGVLTAGEVDFIIGANFLVTVGGRGKAAHWEDRDIERVLSLEQENLGQGPDFLLHALVNYVIDGKHNAINSLESEVDEAEESIVKDLSRFHMSRLVHLRKNILVMRKSLFHEREIFIKLCRRDSPFVGEKAIYHFRNCYDHIAKYFEEAEIYREVILSLTEMYLSMVNNQMSQIANRTNTTVRRLTFITTIFMPLTLLAGIGGMSEWSMMTGPANWKTAYPEFMLGMVVIGALTYAVLRYMDAKLKQRTRGE